MLTYDDIIERLKDEADPEKAAGMAKYGISGDHVYGIKVPVLRTLAKAAGKRNHGLSVKLWKEGSREGRILAAFLEDPKQVSEAQLEEYIQEFHSWEVVDQWVMTVIEKTQWAYDKAFEWSLREPEFEKRTGFVLMARIAHFFKGLPDEKVLAFLPFIEREANDERNFVKKAVNWALREIGKRNAECYYEALACAKKLAEMESRSAKWIARDAIRELESEKVKEKLGL